MSIIVLTSSLYCQVCEYNCIIIIIIGGATTAEAEHTTIQYIDDEYTPGVFEIWAVKFLPHLSRVRRTYATWKPVSYHRYEVIPTSG